MDKIWWLIGAMVIVGGLSIEASRKARVAKTRFLTQHPGALSMTDLSSEVQNFLKTGKRIPALRQFRRETGLGLKDAKAILDDIAT